MKRPRFALLWLIALGALVFPAAASAEHGNADLASPNMFHVANDPTPPQFQTGPSNEARFNSDLAFWESGAVRGLPADLAAQGNYDGFRLINIKNPERPVDLSVVECRSNQGDLSFYQARDRLLLIQSIDRPVTTDECATARDTGITVAPDPITGVPRTRFIPGFEGLRIFDVTRPTAPVHIASVPTACGSHTHTTIPDERNQRAIVYVSSYPIGASITPTNFDFGGPRCTTPHAKISIVEIPDRAPETARVLKEQPLDADTLPFRGTLGSGGTGAVGCHDITALYDAQSARRAGQSFDGNSIFQVAGAACLEEGQLWDISDPANPTTTTTHSHIRNLFISTRGLFHTASFSMDGNVVLFTDEFEGGGGSGCKGPQDTTGNVFFYRTVPPGTAVVPLLGRYQIPRPQPPNEACTLHNGNVVTTTKADIGVSSAYQGGISVFDFSAAEDAEPMMDELPGEPGDPIPPIVAEEVAFFDPQGTDGRGRSDEWSSYWHNDFIYSSSGLRPQPPRGFDVYKILLPDGQQTPQAGDTPDSDDRQFRARKLRYQNPQTQDTYLQTGQGR
jgi:hypothetical protein